MNRRTRQRHTRSSVGAAMIWSLRRRVHVVGDARGSPARSGPADAFRRRRACSPPRATTAAPPNSRTAAACRRSCASVRGGRWRARSCLSASGSTSRPTSTRSSFDRSPMILRIGSGNLRTSVGTARIWSPAASLRVHQQVDHLDAVAAGQVRLADLLEVVQRGARTWRSCRRRTAAAATRLAGAAPAFFGDGVGAHRRGLPSACALRRARGCARRGARRCRARAPPRPPPPASRGRWRTATSPARSSASAFSAAICASSALRRFARSRRRRVVVLPRSSARRQLLRLLRDAGGAGQHPVARQVDVHQVDAVVAEDELAHLVGVRACRAT